MTLSSTPNAREEDDGSDASGIMFKMACEVFEADDLDGESSYYVVHNYFDEKSSQAVSIGSGEDVSEPQLIISSQPNNE